MSTEDGKDRLGDDSSAELEPVTTVVTQIVQKLSFADGFFFDSRRPRSRILATFKTVRSFVAPLRWSGTKVTGAGPGFGFQEDEDDFGAGIIFQEHAIGIFIAILFKLLSKEVDERVASMRQGLR